MYTIYLDYIIYVLIHLNIVMILHNHVFTILQEDIFKLQAKDLGALNKVRIRHDNSGLLGAAWFLDRVEVEDAKHKKT